MRRLPLAYGATAELVPLVRAELELCAVAPGEVVAIHADYETDPHYPAAALGAALSLGAQAFQIWSAGDEAVQAWRASDLIVDLRRGKGLGATRLAVEAARAGRRVLAFSEPADVLTRLFPDPATVARAREAAARLSQAEAITLTSTAGTDLHLSKARRPGLDQHGYSEAPGRWDRWPSARVVCAPLEDSADGRVVLRPGDLLLTLGRYVETEVTLTFRGGRLRAVEGVGADALVLRDWLAAAPDDRAGVLAGFSWGLDRRARWDRIAMRFAPAGGAHEAMSRDGAVVLLFGDNTAPSLGGANATAARFAVALRDQAVRLDGATAVDRGATAA